MPSTSPLCLEVQSGPHAGRRIPIAGNLPITVGRSEPAQVPLPGDMGMSSVHFAVGQVEGEFRVKDANSRNGTFINDQRVAESALKAGDVLLAGNTRFRVVEEPASNPSAGSRTRVVVQPKAVLSAPASFSTHVAPSGLQVFEGTGDEASACSLVLQLANACPLHMIVDYSRLELDAPEPLKGMHLFDWMEASWAFKMTPLLIPAQFPIDREELLRAGWGKNGVTCVYSRLGAEAMLSQFRKALRGEHQDNFDPDRDSILGICWPDVIVPILMQSTPDEGTRLMNGIDAVLVEGKPPLAWRAISSAGLAKPLRSLGLVERNDAPAAAGHG